MSQCPQDERRDGLLLGLLADLLLTTYYLLLTYY